MTKEVEKIIRLGKDRIIQLALELVDEDIDPGYFAQVKIKANSKEVMVSFLHPIKFLPRNSVFCYNIFVSLIGERVYYDIFSNPSGSLQTKAPIFRLEGENKEKFQFVVDAINKSPDVGSLKVENYDADMRIREEDDHYDIIVTSKHQKSFYKIKKHTGTLYDDGHSHLIPMPTLGDEDIMKEIF
ncbi:MAG: hypothetical protein ACOCVN_02385 [bacterium]